MKGTIHGGTLVNVDLSSINPLCRFGKKLVSAQLASNSSLRCVSPPHNADLNIGLSISINGGNQWSNQVPFEFIPNVKTYGLEPSKGPTIGNTTVFISGEYFDIQTSLRCQFGQNNLVAAIWISNSSLRCLTMPHPPGFVSVVLMDAFDTIVGQHMQFEYHASPMIFSFSPSNGVEHGGTLVRVFGRHLEFLQQPMCRFDQTSSQAVVIQADIIMCRSPPIFGRRNVEFGVVDPATIFEWYGGFLFEYLPEPFISSVSLLCPQNALLVVGKNWNPRIGSTWCRYTSRKSEGVGSIIEALFYNDTHIECHRPSASSMGNDQNVLLDVSTNRIDWSSSIWGKLL